MFIPSKNEREQENKMIQIKHCFTGAVLFECDKDSIKLAVEFAVKNKANLQVANLQGANLRGAKMDKKG